MNSNIGNSFDDFLEEEGISAEVEAGAVKKIISYQLQDALDKEKLTKTELAQKLDTSRAAVNRLLDPDNYSVTLNTLVKAASVLGRHVSVAIR